MSQFRKADSSVYSTFLDMIEKVFPELSGYSFGLLFREKIKKSRGGLILAEACQPGKLLSYFAKNDNGNPFDFLIIVDEMAWSCAADDDKIRIMRHELRHINISEKGVPRLIGHDFQDFYIEVELNKDNPSWCQHVAEVTLAGYAQVKDGQPDPRTQHRVDGQVTKDPQRQTHLAPDFAAKLAKVARDATDKILVAGNAPKFSVPTKKREEMSEMSTVRDKSNKKQTLDDLARDRGLLRATA